jgi:hypothetical protein
MRVLFAVICSAALCAGADIEHVASLETGYAQMYNLQFDDAHRTFRQWENAHPGDPLGPASDAAAYLFSEFDRLHILQSEFFAEDQNFLKMSKLTPDPSVKAGFEAALRSTQQLTATVDNGNPNAVLAEVLQHGLHSDYLALIEKRYVAALGETKQARTAAERVLSSDPNYYDANLAVGIENYMLSLKPAIIRVFLRATGSETDKQAGIDKLRLTAAKGHYFAPFAKLLLAVAALRDKNTSAAREQLSWLSAHYPENRLFRAELAKVQ